jgi:hypothetical protein
MNRDTPVFDARLKLLCKLPGINTLGNLLSTSCLLNVNCFKSLTNSPIAK